MRVLIIFLVLLFSAHSFAEDGKSAQKAIEATIGALIVQNATLTERIEDLTKQLAEMNRKLAEKNKQEIK